ncbi:MAG: hypothetical protein OSA42_06215 [Porticoccaceae bacterium]|nr:hypothetical protein [Porticoccaceae bacterium]
MLTLRTAPPNTLTEALQHFSNSHPKLLIHMHIAEQLYEKEQCSAILGKRPDEWLLENHPINPP